MAGATQKSWRPTNKWMAAQCTATATLEVSWVNAGAWTKPLTIAMIGLVSQAVVGYLVSNGDPSPAASAASVSDLASPAASPASAAAPPSGAMVPGAGARSATA